MKSISLDRTKLVTWDVDGTLYSLRRMKWHIAAKYIRKVIKGEGALARRELVYLKRYRGMIDRARADGGDLSDVLRDDLDLRSLESLALRWYVEAITKTGPRAGVEHVLTMFRDRGIVQVASSDYEAGAKLQSLGLEKYFDAVYVGERLGAVKPNPAVLKRISADFSVPIESMLHIGDRVDRDEAAAKAAGCSCLILGRDFRNFHSLLKHLIPREGK